MYSKKAFSLIELSIVILVIGILVIGITKGSRIMGEAKLKTARSLTSSSPVVSMPSLVLWLDATDDSTIATGTVASNSYIKPNDNADVAKWKDRNPQQVNATQKELAATLDTNRPKYIVSGIGGLPTLQFFIHTNTK
jgi:prepilin-type N-terminal cleavage/methylation domain-containing protein